MTSIFFSILKHFKLGYKVLHLVYDSSPKWSTVFFTFKILGSFFPAISLFFGKLIIDSIITAIKNPGPEHFQSVIILIIGSAIFNLLWDVWAIIEQHSNNVLKDLFGKHAIYRVAHQGSRLDLSYFENPKFHDQLEKVQREINLRPFQTLEQLANILSFSTQLISFLFILIRLAWFIPLILLAISIPRFIVRLKYSSSTYSITDRRSPQNRLVNQLIGYLIDKKYASEIKIFNLGDYLLGKFEKLYDTFIVENKNLSTKNNFKSFALDVVDVIINLLFTIFIAIQAIASSITIGDISLYLSSISRFQAMLNNLFRSSAAFYEATLFLSHYFDFIELKPKIANSPNPKTLDQSVPLTIEFKDVHFSYEDGPSILKGINFKVTDGKNLAIIGENGAGKTTLIKLLLRLYEPTSGQVLIGGIDIKEIDLTNLRENIGVIFQDFKSYDLSVRENIGFGDVRQINNIGKIRQAARLSGAAQFIEKFSDKYRTILGRTYEKGEELSGGQWQKIAIARAFFKDAKVIIMDEPTSALDPKSEYDVFKNLIAHTKNKSLILISHRFSTVRVADEIIVLHHGQIVEQGSHEELIKKNGRYAKLYNLQAKWYK